MTMNWLSEWHSILACPLDHTPLTIDESAASIVCPTCGFTPAMTTVPQREGAVVDFRAVDIPQDITLTVHIPTPPLDRYALVDSAFQAINADFEHYSRQEIRQRFGTKLDKAMQYYAQKLLAEHGPDAPILDLGCGSGGNRRQPAVSARTGLPAGANH